MNVPATVAKRYQLKAYTEQNEVQDDTRITGVRADIEGTEYHTGDTIVTSICPLVEEPVFGQIRTIYSQNNQCVFSCVIYNTEFSKHYHGYRIQYLSEEVVTVFHSKLPYSQPVGTFTSASGQRFFTLRHAII